MNNIYRSSLDQKFEAIMETIAQELGYAGGLNGLTADRRTLVENMAEQAIINWTSERRRQDAAPRPITNLQHLLDEYCSLADHL